MTQDNETTKYSQEYFEQNGPHLINQFGDWGVFIDGEQVDGPFYSRQDAMDAYADHIREQAHDEPKILTEQEMAIIDAKWRMDHPADNYGLEQPLLPADQLRLEEVVR